MAVLNFLLRILFLLFRRVWEEPRPNYYEDGLIFDTFGNSVRISTLLQQQNIYSLKVLYNGTGGVGVWVVSIDTLQRQFGLYIPSLGIARPQPQFPHSCVLERFIYSQDQSTYSSSRTGRPIVRSQTHECGNWDWGPDSPFLEIFVSNFRHFVFAV